MIRYLISIFILTLIASVLQLFSPEFASWSDARIMILPLVFLCAAVTLDIAPMLALAFFCGFIWDAQNALASAGGDESVYTQPAEVLRFGYSIFLYGAMGMLMHGIQPLFRMGKWQVSTLLSGIAIFLYLWAEYLLLTFIRGELIFPIEVLKKISYSAILCMLISPLIFLLLLALAKRFGHQIKYQGYVWTSRYITPKHL
ncbi:hypothetical protein [Persicirhabdus sediminis]|uniref:Rod shape-determining protein MreD n=1 Tax=Persicirhabdus sediminis TaxID=454144 RepID=A0A8J7SNG0_9BACT|nr:hypothetical protein [Persicirhabdus sediminis]MBK1791658.1 hypothetical protein [Persicirhabdus sediminis]